MIVVLITKLVVVVFFRSDGDNQRARNLTAVVVNASSIVLTWEKPRGVKSSSEINVGAASFNKFLDFPPFLHAYPLKGHVSLCDSFGSVSQHRQRI